MTGNSVTNSVVNTTATLTDALDQIAQLPTDPPSLYVDLEGETLSRKGTLAIITVFVKPQNHVYIFDVLELEAAIYETPGSNGITLKQIFESPTIPKVFFDVRNDSDALFFHYGIALQGVQDVQLMELASRAGHIRGKRLLSGLNKCIERDGGLNSVDKASWNAAKQRRHAIFDAKPAQGIHIFAKRPFSEEAIQYCIGDVCILPRLHRTYRARLNTEWKAKVERETLARVSDSEKASYQPHGRHKALGPWSAPAQDPFDEGAFFEPVCEQDLYANDPLYQEFADNF